METIWESIRLWLCETGIRIVVALLLLAISFRLINRLARRLEKRAQKRESGGGHTPDKTLVKVLLYGGKIAAKSAVVICLVGYLGLETSGLTALFASFGVTFGLAVNGALGNLAGGILLLVTRPFGIDDYIESGDAGGTVEDIRMTYTKLRTPDNRVLYLPNGKLSGENIVNFSEKENRRVDFPIPVGFGCDVSHIREILLKTATRENVLSEPAPAVLWNEYGDGGPVLTLRVWVKSQHFWDVRWALGEEVYTALNNAGIAAPHRQTDVYMK